MNDWFRDPRAKNGEAMSLAAERAERRNNLRLAHALYADAAESFASVALTVPTDHPNTRGDLAIAAIACFARAQDFAHAVELARQFLAQPGGISDDARSELEKMEADYVPRIDRPRLRTKRAPARGRNEVRSAFAFARDAA